VKVTNVGTGQSKITENGFFTFGNIPKGRVTLKYEKLDGALKYIVTQQAFDLASDVNNGGVADVNLSPVMKPSEWRATIKWDARPRDLDTYVKWGWSKVYYGGKLRSASGLSGKLEADDTNGHGPETAFFSGVGNCRGNSYRCDMRYIINDYSNTRNMPNYRAEVTLYHGATVAGTWKISDCANAIDGSKNNWHVFTIDGKNNRLKWHCGQGGAGQHLLLDSAGLNATKTQGSNAVDYEDYVGPFPGRYFRHSQHKHMEEMAPRLPAVKKFLF